MIFQKFILIVFRENMCAIDDFLESSETKSFEASMNWDDREFVRWLVLHHEDRWGNSSSAGFNTDLVNSKIVFSDSDRYDCYLKDDV